MLNKRSDRKPAHRAEKGRRSAKNADQALPSQNGATGSNGNAPDAPTRTLDREASLRLQEVLLERHLVTEAQIDQAFATQVESGSADFGEALLHMGFVDERELIDARAELYGMDVADLRQTTPEPEALALIPDSMAREHFVIPVRLDEVGLHVAMADQPSPELLTLLSETSGTFDPTDAGATLRDPSRHRQQLPRHRWPRSPRPGVRGRRDHTETDASTRRRRPPRSFSTTTHRSSRSSAAFSPRPCATGHLTSTSSRRTAASAFATGSTAHSKRS